MEPKNYYWYTVNVQFFVEDEASGKVKKVKESYLIKGVSITDAETQVAKDLEGMISDYRIINVTETKYVKVIVPKNIEINA